MSYHDWKYMFGIPGDDYSSGMHGIAQNFTFANTWFEYGVIWDEYRLIWTLDDAPVRAVYKYFYFDNGAYNPISNQMLLQFYLNYAPNNVYMNIGFPSDFSNIIYNIQIPNFGGRYDGVNDDNTCSAIGTPLQTQMEVDWVRVYAPRSCSDTIVHRNNKQLPTVIAAQQIELGGGTQGQEVVVQNLKPNENDESFA